jgi:hypothetical protein
MFDSVQSLTGLLIGLLRRLLSGLSNDAALLRALQAQSAHARRRPEQDETRTNCLPTAPFALNGPPTSSAASATSPPFSNLEPTEPVVLNLSATSRTASFADSVNVLSARAGEVANVRASVREGTASERANMATVVDAMRWMVVGVLDGCVRRRL